jgi:DNA invertase Pin-like site-specific DNA recombinase
MDLDLTRPQAIDRSGWYLRVSTPKQKLEHQREHVLRFCEANGINVPLAMRYEDKEKRHRADKRQDFQRLLATVKAGQLDWIIICSFDRWGVADVDEFFEFRRLLLNHDVQLWSVIDQMNLTGISEGDYFRIVAMAIGATRYVDQMAEKNILKMIEMAKQGWAASGNSPYGLDLVCYPIQDICKPLFRVVRLKYRPYLYRILWYSPESRVERNAEGHVIRERLEVIKDETTDRMPARDKKATGYRYEPTLEEGRIKSLNLAYEMYDAGMGWADIGKALFKTGHLHYDKPFQDHALETILGNPAYIGLPAWGKIGTGAYRVLLNGGPVRVKRKSTDTVYLRKDEDQWIQPAKPLYPALVPVDLWQRVRDRLQDRQRTNPDFGKRRTRARATHPLNGKLICPDCQEPMVLGSYCPAEGTGKKRTRCFNCGTYRKHGRLKCYANTIGWDRIDNALENLLATVKDRIGSLTALNGSKGLLQEEWLKQTELGRILLEILCFYMEGSIGKPKNRGQGKWEAVCLEDPDSLINWLRVLGSRQAPLPDALQTAVDWYNRHFAERSQGFQAEMEAIEAELGRIAQALAEGIPSQTVRQHLNNRMGQLEARKTELAPNFVPLTAQADAIRDQLRAVRQTIEKADRLDLARLLDSFIEAVYPIFGPRKESSRGPLLGFRFEPRKTTAARNILPEGVSIDVMELGATRTGTGSSTPPG